MADKKIIVTFSLPIALVNILCSLFKTNNESKAIYKGLMGFLSNDSYSKRMDDYALHQLLTIEERRNTKAYSIRIPSKLRHILAQYTVVDTLYNVPTIILANSLYYSDSVPASVAPAELNLVTLPKEIAVDKSLHLIRLLGNKWSEGMQYAIQKIRRTSNKCWATSVEIFMGALGIFSNFSFANHEVLNDIDLQKVNLYKAIRDSEDTVLIEMLSKSVDEETFNESKNSMKKGFELSNKKINIEAAGDYLYTNLLSVRSTGITFKGMSFTTYKHKMNAIYPLHERLKNTEIYGVHAFDIIKKHRKDKGTVFIADPPYLDTNVYEETIKIDKKYSDDEKEFGYAEHLMLAKMLRETHQRYGNDFIYFCRITVTRVKDQKTKEITNVDELETGDRHMQGRIDDLYWGYGFYYIDVPYSSDGTIERIITSFEFDGAMPYGGGQEQTVEEEVE